MFECITKSMKFVFSKFFSEFETGHISVYSTWRWCCVLLGCFWRSTDGCVLRRPNDASHFDAGAPTAAVEERRTFSCRCNSGFRTKSFSCFGSGASRRPELFGRLRRFPFLRRRRRRLRQCLSHIDVYSLQFQFPSTTAQSGLQIPHSPISSTIPY